MGYHATAAEVDYHLAKCMVYIDFNMIKTGVVSHAFECEDSRFNKIQKPLRCYVYNQ